MSETTENGVLQRTPTHPLVLLQSAIERGLDPDKLGKLMDLAERWEKNRAAEEFARAMNACQAEMPAIVRDKENTHTRSRYAAYESLNATVKPIYTKHGFSISWGTADSPQKEHVRIVAQVRHVGGHCEPYYADIPLDAAGVKGTANKTAVQATGSTYSYGRRYLTKMIFNLAEADEDNDGAGACVTPEQIGVINDLLAELRQAGRPVDFKRFLKWLGVESLDQLPAKDFTKCVATLQEKKRQKEATA